MNIKLKKNCKLECWSGREDCMVSFRKGDGFEVKEFDENTFVSESNFYGTIFIEKNLVEV